jgi:hypothetical protein
MANPFFAKKDKTSKGDVPNNAAPFQKKGNPKKKVTKTGTPVPVQGQAPTRAGPIPSNTLGSMVGSLKGLNK